jgi:hypothetical protein
VHRGQQRREHGKEDQMGCATGNHTPAYWTEEAGGFGSSRISPKVASY